MNVFGTSRERQSIFDPPTSAESVIAAARRARQVEAPERQHPQLKLLEGGRKPDGIALAAPERASTPDDSGWIERRSVGVALAWAALYVGCIIAAVMVGAKRVAPDAPEITALR